MRLLYAILVAWTIVGQGEHVDPPDLIADEGELPRLPVLQEHGYSLAPDPPVWMNNGSCCHHEGTFGNATRGAGPVFWSGPMPTHKPVDGRYCAHPTINIDTPNETLIQQSLCDTFDANGECIDYAQRTVYLLFEQADFRDSMGEEEVEACRSGPACVAPRQDVWFNDQSFPDSEWCSPNTKTKIKVKKSGRKHFIVGSNKTVKGYGWRNSDHMMRMYGRGFKISGGNSNVIIRNIVMGDINPHFVSPDSDAIIIDNASRVVIEHMSIGNVGRFHIRTGPGPATEVSILNNVFEGASAASWHCLGRHPWFVSLNSTNQTVTLARNNFRNGGGGWSNGVPADVVQGLALRIGDKNVSNMKSLVHSFNNWYYNLTYGSNMNRELVSAVAAYGGPESYFLDEGTRYEYSERYVNNEGSPSKARGVASWSKNGNDPGNAVILDKMAQDLLGRTIEENFFTYFPEQHYYPNDTGALQAFKKMSDLGLLSGNYLTAHDFAEAWMKKFGGYLPDYNMKYGYDWYTEIPEYC